MKIIVVLIFMLCSIPSNAATKCKAEWDSLKSVQSQLRHQSTEGLRQKEHQKHNEYQACRKRKAKSFKAEVFNKKINRDLNQRPRKQKVIHYSGNLKGRYKGEKQNAWTLHYKTPKECIKPKSVQAFAVCINHRDAASKIFDKHWENINLPSPIKLSNH